jgi:hypothetical protein
MQHYTYGHNRQLYLRQLGRLYFARPEAVRPLLAELELIDRPIVAAELALTLAVHNKPIPPIAQIRAELFGE